MDPRPAHRRELPSNRPATHAGLRPPLHRSRHCLLLHHTSLRSTIATQPPSVHPRWRLMPHQPQTTQSGARDGGGCDSEPLLGDRCSSDPFGLLTTSAGNRFPTVQGVGQGVGWRGAPLRGPLGKDTCGRWATTSKPAGPAPRPSPLHPHHPRARGATPERTGPHRTSAPAPPRGLTHREPAPNRRIVPKFPNPLKSSTQVHETTFSYAIADRISHRARFL
jgi:hypothetical protein